MSLDVSEIVYSRIEMTVLYIDDSAKFISQFYEWFGAKKTLKKCQKSFFHRFPSISEIYDHQQSILRVKIGRVLFFVEIDPKLREIDHFFSPIWKWKFTTDP